MWWLEVIYVLVQWKWLASMICRSAHSVQYNDKVKSLAVWMTIANALEVCSPVPGQSCWRLCLKLSLSSRSYKNYILTTENNIINIKWTAHTQLTKDTLSISNLQQFCSQKQVKWNLRLIKNLHHNKHTQNCNENLDLMEARKHSMQ